MSKPTYCLGGRKKRNVFVCGQLYCKKTFRFDLYPLKEFNGPKGKKIVDAMRTQGRFKECFGCTHIVVRCEDCADKTKGPLNNACCKCCDPERDTGGLDSFIPDTWMA